MVNIVTAVVLSYTEANESWFRASIALDGEWSDSPISDHRWKEIIRLLPPRAERSFNAVQYVSTIYRTIEPDDGSCQYLRRSFEYALGFAGRMLGGRDPLSQVPLYVRLNCHLVSHYSFELYTFRLALGKIQVWDSHRLRYTFAIEISPSIRERIRRSIRDGAFIATDPHAKG